MKKLIPKEIEIDEATSAESYAYIEYKAHKFLEVGYITYTEDDAFKQPGIPLSPAIIQMLTSGCEQIRDKKGLTRENPFEGLGISGFYQLMRMFHFVSRQQEAQISLNEPFIIDKITFEHQVGGELQRIVLFNKVKKK